MEIEGDVRQKRTVISQDIIYENVTYYLQKQKKTSNKIIIYIVVTICLLISQKSIILGNSTTYRLFNNLLAY